MSFVFADLFKPNPTCIHASKLEPPQTLICQAAVTRDDNVLQSTSQPSGYVSLRPSHFNQVNNGLQGVD